MERLSVCAIGVYKLLRENPNRWFTSAEISREAKIAGRTARAHVKAFSKSGVFDVLKLSSGFKYKFKTKSKEIELVRSALGIGKESQ